MNKLNWAVLGTGVVANQMAQAMQGVGCKLYAVGNRTHSKAVDFIEIMEYPRACKATIVCTETGERKEICEGETERALQYEMEDMEEEISKRSGCMLREYTKDVMEIMTDIRNEWGLKYPEEQ